MLFMVVYQYCHLWKKFLIWTGVVKGIISFAIFPILVKLGFLTIINKNCNVSFSYVAIFVIASFSRWVVLGVLNIQQNAKDKQRTLNDQPAMESLDKADRPGPSFPHSPSAYSQL